MQEEEFVLTIRTKLFNKIGYFQGFTTNTQNFLELISDYSNLHYIKRELAENDFNFKQLIPYALIEFKQTYFSYQRGKLLSEKRLYNNFSIGIGGHISILDKNLFSQSFDQALLREINEEIEIKCDFKPSIIGLINDDTNDVGKVHLGIVYLVQVSTNEVKPKEKSIKNCSFLPLRQLIMNYDSYENWSKICIDFLRHK